MNAPRIALIHAVTVAMDPVQAAFARDWPQATLINLLDDSLSQDRERAGDLSAAITARIEALADYALAAEASAILYTCSAFGAAIERVQARLSIPVLKPNEAMFDAALASGARVGMLATFAPSVASMESEFCAAADARGSKASIRSVVVPEAMRHLKAGDGSMHDHLLAEAAPRLQDCDAVLLAHFSTARARDAVSARLRCPVLTSPDSAVSKLRRAMGLGAAG
ncbi:MAG: aspartate/glutamate racemase family protein [Burkholderiales bacterium]